MPLSSPVKVPCSMALLMWVTLSLDEAAGVDSTFRSVFLFEIAAWTRVLNLAQLVATTLILFFPLQGAVTTTLLVC